MASPVLEIREASRVFADRTALNAVNLSATSGEIVALLGPNGAGKTSLMRAVSGRLKLDSGTVAVAGQEPSVSQLARRQLGVVPQTIALYQQLSAAENLDVFARLMGLKGSRVRAAVETGLRRAGLEERRNDSLTELSGGMQRRLNIVAATLHEPRLLLLDEPTVGVDIAARERIHDLLRELRDAGMAILLSTHDFEQAAAIADRVIFMANGRVLMEGRTRELVREIFGDARELVVSLVRAAEAQHADLLRDLQLLPTMDPVLWSGPLDGGAGALPAIEEQLQRAGLEVAELRLREPGLQSVYMHLTVREQG